MKSDEDYISEKQLEDFERALQFSRPYIDRAERAHAFALNGLWIGNAGAAITMLGLIGGLAKDKPELVQRLLLPLSLFVLGVIVMGIGAGVSLVQQGLLARRLEGIDSIMKIRMGDIKRPTEAAGLSLRDWRTISGCIAAAAFVAGCILGLLALAQATP